MEVKRDEYSHKRGRQPLIMDSETSSSTLAESEINVNTLNKENKSAKPSQGSLKNKVNDHIFLFMLN